MLLKRFIRPCIWITFVLRKRWDIFSMFYNKEYWINSIFLERGSFRYKRRSCLKRQRKWIVDKFMESLGWYSGLSWHVGNATWYLKSPIKIIVTLVSHLNKATPCSSCIFSRSSAFWAFPLRIKSVSTQFQIILKHTHTHKFPTVTVVSCTPLKCTFYRQINLSANFQRC